MHWSEEGLILKVIGGSHAYGMNTPTSDIDYRGVALPPPSWLIGFPPGDDSSLTKESKTADDDLTIHTLTKFCRLALKGNPNILEILFCRDQDVAHLTEAGAQLRALGPRFLSRRAYAAFSGYAFGQLKRARTARSRHGVHSDLVELYGVDTKNLAHLIRLMRMGLELIRDGEVNVYRPDASLLLDIRNGKYTLNQVEKMAEELDAECLAAISTSPLPEKPDEGVIEAWVMAVQRAWVNGDKSLLSPCAVSGGTSTT